MALFANLFKPQAPAPAPKPGPGKAGPVPAQLPKITAPTAAQITQHFDPSPAARALLVEHQTPSQFLSALQEKQMGGEMVKTIAYGLPDREGVLWAVLSAQKVADNLPALDKQALRAAQTWLQNPLEANQTAAAAAAAATDYLGPGAWAAQAAAWVRTVTPDGQPDDDAAVSRLTPQAVAAAVLVSATIKAKPLLAPTFADHQYPLIALGLEIAAGKNA